MALKRISILGVGLMGGSLGLACRKADLHVTGYSPKPNELRLAKERGAIDDAAVDAVEAVADADLVILCTPIGVFAKLLSSIATALKPGAIVTDVGSTKRSVVKLAEQLLPSVVRFVGSHPMAGGEKHGIENARADLLTGALCIVTVTDSTDANAIEKVEYFWQLLKIRTVRMTPQVHDELTADISHLPHAIAASLVRIQSPEALQLAARGFLDTTRIASGDPALWTDILLENRDNLRSGIVDLQNDLQQLLNHLDTNNTAAVRQWLTTAAEVRSGFRKSAD
jgi:prephenate dehydrogenase